MSPHDAVAARLALRPPKRLSHPSARWAAVAVVLAPLSDPAVLLIQRALRAGDRWSGHIGLPGGRREPLDADLRVTAVRETLEEVRLDLSGVRLLGELDDVAPFSTGAHDVIVRPFVFGLGERPAVGTSEEVAGTLWLPLSQLAASESTAKVPEIAEPVPAYVLGETVVWGMTRRILKQVVERLA